MQPEKLKIQILLIGKTGHGKSSLGNFLLGQKDLFNVYDSPLSRTQVTMKCERNGLTIIDSPGLLDSGNEGIINKENYQNLMNYL